MGSRMKNTVLIVDRDWMVRRLLDKIVGHFFPHLQTMLLDNAQQALDAVEADIPCLIIMDSRLPGADGLEMIELLTHHRATREIPVIFMTAPSQAEALQRYLHTRQLTTCYIEHKPVDLSDFHNTINRALS